MRFETEVSVKEDVLDLLREKFGKEREGVTVTYTYNGEQFSDVHDLIHMLVSDGIVEEVRNVETVKSKYVLEVEGVTIDTWSDRLIINTWSDDEQEHRERVNKVLKKLAEIVPEISDIKCTVFKTVTEECRV